MARWTEDILTILSLATRGVMVLVDDADDAHLRELFLAVREAHPTADVVLTPEALFDAAPGSVLLYLPQPEHADALNAGRPMVAERALKVLLWCPTETTHALATRAPDFYDWISHVVPCPLKPAPWVVATFRCAMAYPDVPGVVWQGLYSPEEGIEAAGARVTRRISSAATPGEMVAAASEDREGWLWVEGVDARSMMEVRWACAEARRTGRVVVSGNGLWNADTTAGWWHLKADPYDIRAVFDYLSNPEDGEDDDGPRLTPAELVALGTEPGTWNAVDRATEDWRGAMASSVDDPGAYLAEISLRRGESPAEAAVIGDAAGARAYWTSEVAVRARAELDAEVTRELTRRGAVGLVRGIGLWAARNALNHWPVNRHDAREGDALYLLEALLRGCGRELVQQPSFYVLSQEAPLRWRRWWLQAHADDGHSTSATVALARGLEALARDAFGEAQRWIEAALVTATSEAADAQLIPAALAATIRMQVERAETEVLTALLPQATAGFLSLIRVGSATAVDNVGPYIARNAHELGPEVVAEVARLFLREGDFVRADGLLSLLPEQVAHPVMAEVRCELWYERGEHALLNREADALPPNTAEGRRAEILKVRSAIRRNDLHVLPTQFKRAATVPEADLTTHEARILEAYAEWMLAHGAASEALVVAERARTVFVTRYDPTHPAVGSLSLLLGEGLLRLGRYAEGRQRLEEAVAMLTERLGRGHHTTLRARILLALEHRRAGTTALAGPVEPLLTRLIARLGSHHPWVGPLFDRVYPPGARGTP